MKVVHHILAVVNHTDDGEAVLLKAAALARNNDASIHVVKVIHEGIVDLSVHEVEQSHELKTWIMQAEESFLEDLLDTVIGDARKVDSCVLWNKYGYQGILDAATEFRADLIIKGTDHPRQEVIRTPGDWNLLRHARIPVMLVKPIAWKDDPCVLAAVDVHDDLHQELCEHIAETASRIADALQGRLALVSTFPSVEKWVGPVTLAIDFEAARTAVRNQLEHDLNELAGRYNIHPDSVYTEEGDTHTALENLVKTTGADILVIGTSRRHGIPGPFLGNTAEAILYHVNCDVLVLH